ncbi:hypothetical protein BCR32DRAFT_324669 [Anaeromyces robustus]|uniref:Uncharacterized protein n=1 Tax=Anaeromyces robustus TaxID=1754192 RepID=A0A1Y1XMH3_9FUNG|nr:hypothetical protein BCR32DRAFT_324669 [Anaeromyces robustus]|eukprot:ORX86949.1 hypothetical protein BCR32DRAFT_324669 [Anaeromyces robustus]
MKFTTPFIILLGIHSVYSVSFDIIKRDQQGLNVSPECQKDIDTKEEFHCLGLKNTLNSTSLKKECPIVLSETCKNFYESENPISYFPNCQNETDFALFKSKNGIKYVKGVSNFVCSTDGDGKICPSAEATINGLKINDKNANETCYSKKCTLALDEFLGNVLDSLPKLEAEKLAITNGSIQVFQLLKNLINTEQCSSKAKDDTKSYDPANSGSNSIVKISNTLLFVIGLLLTYIQI